MVAGEDQSRSPFRGEAAAPKLGIAPGCNNPTRTPPARP